MPCAIVTAGCATGSVTPQPTLSASSGPASTPSETIGHAPAAEYPQPARVTVDELAVRVGPGVEHPILERGAADNGRWFHGADQGERGRGRARARAVHRHRRRRVGTRSRQPHVLRHGRVRRLDIRRAVGRAVHRTLRRISVPQRGGRLPRRDSIALRPDGAALFRKRAVDDRGRNAGSHRSARPPANRKIGCVARTSSFQRERTLSAYGSVCRPRDALARERGDRYRAFR